MTDNKIVKALECCSKAEIYDECKKMKCPLFLGLSMGCKYVDKENQLYSDALDLINRQKAEIERLEKIEIEIDDFCRRLCRMRMLNGNAIASYEDLRNYIQEEKSEAIKEFAERLKDEMRLEDDCQYDCMNCYYECKEYIPVIDELVQRMVGENND